MKNIVSQQTLNLSIYVAAILVFWALTLNKCIMFNSESINLSICSKDNYQESLFKGEENINDCNLIDETEIEIKNKNDNESIIDIPSQEILKEHSNKLV